MKKYKINIYLILMFLILNIILGNAQISSGNNTWGNELNYFAHFNGADFDRPIVIIEGFDIEDNYSTISLFSTWWNGDFSNNTFLINAGFDFVYVDFINNTQDMHLNTELIKDFIRDVNTTKVGTQEGILIGQSMGGVIARMALKELEDEPYDHEMGLFISYDAPHKGANIPIGFQAALEEANDFAFSGIFDDTWFDMLLNIFGAGSANPQHLEDKLNSTASQQMLINHLKGSSEYNALQTDLSNLGYPNETRNVALVSGSNSGVSLNFQPGARVYEKRWGNCWFGNEFNVIINMTDINTSSQMVSELAAKVPPCITVDGGKKYFTSGAQCYDNCPGGKFSTDGYSTHGIDYFSFVPTVSAVIEHNKNIAEKIANFWFFLYNFNSTLFNRLYVTQRNILI